MIIKQFKPAVDVTDLDYRYRKINCPRGVDASGIVRKRSSLEARFLFSISTAPTAEIFMGTPVRASSLLRAETMISSMMALLVCVSVGSLGWWLVAVAATLDAID